MGIETRKTKINGREYSITTLDADKGVKAAGKIARYCLGPFGALVLGGYEDNPQVIVDGFREFGSFLGDDDFLRLIKELLAEARCDNKEIIFASHFATNYGELFEFTLFAVRENFGSFFDGSGMLRNVLGRARGLLQNLPSIGSSPSSSPAGSPRSASSKPATASTT